MLLKDILLNNAFKVGVDAQTKEEIIEEIARFFESIYHLDFQVVLDSLWAREKKGSTGLGKGLAVPHARIPNIGSMRLAVLYSHEGKDFDSYDKTPTNLFFAAIIDEDDHPQEQLEMLKVIVETCERTDLMEALKKAHTVGILQDTIVRRITEIQNG